VTSSETVELDALSQRIARIIIERLQLEDLTPESFPKHAILFAKEHQGGMGFDSIGSLEIAAGLADDFNLELDDISEQDFMSVETLAAYIAKQQQKASS
jgi:acyl carrier protein